MRRRLQQQGFEFTTDNDSELIAVYLADKLAQGIVLKEALATSIDDLDGTFPFWSLRRTRLVMPRIGSRPSP
jgi:glucosamine 6-phosphate synthetase-like amidotransferase/phosphosugar isomerase protein